MKELCCKKCGSILDRQGELYVCPCCGAGYRNETVMEDLEAMRNLLSEEKQEKVANLRNRLWQEVHKEYTDSESILQISGKIKSLLPDDFQAEFYELANGDSVELLNRFLDGIDTEAEQGYLEDILDFLLKSLTSNVLLAVNNLIERAYKNTDLAKYEKYATLLSEEAEKVDDGVYEPSLTRDVFVAYKSEDMAYVSEIVEKLEAENISCFVAMRNLQHGRGAVGNYNQAIKTAMDNCKIFLFVSTKNSRTLRCDAFRIELPYLKKTDKTASEKKMRVEYLVEGYGDRLSGADREVQKIFDGCEYCYTADSVVERVIDLLTTQRDRSDPVTEQLRFMQQQMQQQIAQYRAVEEEKRSAEAREKDAITESIQRLMEQELSKIQQNKKPEPSVLEELEQVKQRFAEYRAMQEEKERKMAEENPLAKELEEIKRQFAEYRAGQQEKEGLRAEAEPIGGEQKYCLSCGTPNPLYAKFCLNCGNTGFGTQEELEAAKAEETERADTEETERADIEVTERADIEVTASADTEESERADTEADGETDGEEAEEMSEEEACLLGEKYYFGKGVRKDLEKAAQYYLIAAEKGNVDAQYRMGCLYADGAGVEKDEKQAVAWYCKAAVQGHADAQISLGRCYESGKGVTQDRRKAAEWYEPAADGEHPEADFRLGMLLEQGQGIAKDEKTAVECYTRAAEAGHASAANRLALCYRNGVGVEQDEQQAQFWFGKASESGSAPDSTEEQLSIGSDSPEEQQTAGPESTEDRQSEEPESTEDRQSEESESVGGKQYAGLRSSGRRRTAGPEPTEGQQSEEPESVGGKQYAGLRSSGRRRQTEAAEESESADVEAADSGQSLPQAETAVGQRSGQQEKPGGTAQERSSVEEDFLISDGVLKGFRQGLTSVPAELKIPEGVTEIAAHAFEDDASIRRIVCPDSLKTVGESAFSGCRNLESVRLPAEPDSVRRNAFDGCRKLKYHTVNGIRYLGTEENPCVCVIGTEGKELTDAKPETGTVLIGDGAFSGCRELQALELPEGVRCIGRYAFEDCAALPDVSLPDSMVTVGSYAFSGCSSLEKVLIPMHVINMEDYAFWNCKSLTGVAFRED